MTTVKEKKFVNSVEVTKKNDDEWKQWIKKVISNTDHEIKIAFYQLKELKIDISQKTLQHRIGQNSCDALNRVLKEAEEQQKYCPY